MTERMRRQEEHIAYDQADPFRISDIGLQILDALPCGILIVDTELAVRYRNPAAHELLPDRPGAVETLAPVRPGEPFENWGAELESIIGHGRERRWDELNITCRPIHGSGAGEVVGVVVTLAGASAPKPRGFSPRGASAQSTEPGWGQPGSDGCGSNDARLISLGKLTARVAHELNNPLDGILRYINLAVRLAESAANAPERESEDRLFRTGRLLKYLRESRVGLMRMARIVRDVLQFSRGARGRYDNLNINDIVDEAIRAVAPLADAHRVIIAADYQVRDMPAAPAGRLLQVCTNLMKNAIEAMPDGGRLLINTGIVDTDVVLRFADTGPGLPDHVERLFEPFYTTKEPGEGTGLGLAICRDLIEQLGGTIHARNADHEGAVLTVAIPLSACRLAGEKEDAER